MGEVNFTRSAAGFERETAAALTEAAHLEDFRGGKLVQVTDQRVAGIDPLGGHDRTFE